VFSEYGRELITQPNVLIQAGPLDTDGLAGLIASNDIKLVVDASHPYAVNVSQNAMQACRHTMVHYLRYERLATILPAYEKLHVVHDYTAAAEVAAPLGKVIFLTTGSRHLKVFKAMVCLQQHRLIARILPEPSVLTECLSLGFTPQDIVALQGPFSHALNMALFTEYGAEVIITKNSGQVGGSDTKITAAMALNLPLVVIDRPTIAYCQLVDTVAGVIQFVKERNL
jgi:precorrin-6A/cobalt-precorrin-6A reductase